MTTVGRLVTTALVALATAYAVPATRHVLLGMSPARTFGHYPFFRDKLDDRSPVLHLQMAIAWNHRRQCLTPDEVKLRALRAAWAESLAAAAEEHPYDELGWQTGDRLALIDEALRLAPGDETTLARRASILIEASNAVRGSVAMARRALAAADDFVAAYPDNGYAHHLRAAARQATGDCAGAAAAWRDGNRAPRFDRRYAEALARVCRWNARRGESPLVTLVLGPYPASADEDSVLRAAQALVTARAGEADTCRTVIDAGSRWLRECRDFRSRRLGQRLLQASLLRGKVVDREPMAQRDARLRAGGQALGTPTTVVAQATGRIERIDPDHPLDRDAVAQHLRGLGAWRTFASLCLGMATLMLLVASFLANNRRATVPWSGRQLLLAWALALWPFVGCAALMSGWYFRQPEATADTWMTFLIGSMKLPLLAAVAAWLPLASLSRRFGLRGKDVGPRRRDFLQRAGAPYYAATAAMLAMLGVLATVPAAWHGHQTAELAHAMIMTDLTARP